MSIIRHNVLRYITDRPNEVVLKQDIMRECDLAASQVTACVLAIQTSSSIGNEIETLTRGNAWRFTPKVPVVTSGGSNTLPRNRRRPLTHQLREYFQTNPIRIIFIDELVSYTQASETQIKVGVNNLRNGDRMMRNAVKTEVAGRAWRYVPPSTTSTVPTNDDDDNDNDNDNLVGVTIVDDARSARVFEEIGTIGNAVVIRDPDGVLFRAVKMKR